jgi:HK97 family phage portal protein
MNEQTRQSDGWDPNGAVVSTAGIIGYDASGMIVGSLKDFTISQVAKLWLAGNEGSAGDGINAPTHPYSQVLWAYKCIRALHTTCGGIPLRLMSGGANAKYHGKSFRADIRPCTQRSLRAMKGTRGVCQGRAADGEQIEAGQAYELFNQPNSYQDFSKFINATVGFLFARGRVAWILTDFVGRRPGEMHVVDGKLIKPVWDRNAENDLPVLLGYVYAAPRSGARIALSTEEVKYFSLWDDGEDPLGGMAPSLPGRLSLATDYNASLYNAHSLVNGCEPSLAVKFPGSLSAEKREEYRASLNARYRGPANAHKPLILEGGASAEAIGSVLKDMAWDALKTATRIEICAAYDVPPVVAGFVEAAGDSSAYTENALKQFYQQAIFPILDSLLPALQEIASRSDARLVAYWDVEDQPIVQQMRISRIDAAGKLCDRGVPLADANELLDLGLRERPWYQVGMLPGGLVPAHEAAAGLVLPPMAEGPGAGDQGTGNGNGEEEDDERQEPGTGEPGTEEQQLHGQSTKVRVPSGAARINPALAERLWKAFERSHAPLSRRLERIIVARRAAQCRAIARMLRERLGNGGNQEPGTRSQEQRTSRKDSFVLARILIDVFDDPKERQALQARVLPAVTDGYELGVRQALAEAGMSGQALNQAVARIAANPAITRAARADAIRIATRIDDQTRRVLRSSLEEGVAAGEDARHLADRVQAYVGNSRKQALAQARNYIGQTLSAARYEGAKDAGFSHEVWIHSRGEGKRRPAHIAAEKHYAANPKPIGEAWNINGAALRYPRDPMGPPRETINCQCIAVGKRLAGGTAAEARRALLGQCERLASKGFYSYEDMIADRNAA